MSATTPTGEWAAFRSEILAATTRKPTQSRKPKTPTANGLTRQIVAHIRANGMFATRLNSTGLYREGLKKYVPSQQVVGLPDILGIADEGRAFFVEVKAGKDKLSEVQKATIEALISSGARVFIAHDFEGFKTWFIAHFSGNLNDV